MGQKTDICSLALERVQQLFQQASLQFAHHPERSHRYVRLARKICMKAHTRMPASLKRKFCHHCHRYLQSGTNARVRLKDKKLIIFCFSCRHHTRLQLQPAQ